MSEKMDVFVKFRNIVNNSENEMIVRFGIILFGAILGLIFVVMSLLFKTGGGVAVIFIIFGCVIFFISIIGAFNIEW